MRIDGKAKQTYALLCGGIQKGELAFEADKLLGRQDDKQKYYTNNPHPELTVTREALKAFASRNGYNPRFLRKG